MFRRITRFTGVMLALLSVVWGVSIGWVRVQDIQKAKKRLEKQRLAPSTALFSETQQSRKGVIKEIWFSQENGERLHHRICSDTSLLTIVPHDGRFDLIERLQNAACWMQDKVYMDPGTQRHFQQLRFFRAQEGFYRYSSQEFLAQSVDLSLYRLAGRDLPSVTSLTEAPFLKGVARDVSFSLAGKTSQFKAQQFKAELNSFEEKK